MGGEYISLPLTESTTTLPDTIKWHNKSDDTAFTLNWEVSFDNGVNWLSLGTTKHTVYVTLGDPLGGFSNQETLFYIGCKDGDGASSQTDLLDDISLNFHDQAVHPVADPTNAMKYWGPWASSDAATTANPSCFTAEGLLMNGDGRCGAWADLLVKIFQAQGIDDAQVEAVTPTDSTAELLLVKNWDLTDLDNPIDLPGISAQNNSNPQSAFTDHALVKCLGRLFDPSYGNQYVGSDMRANLTAWEDAALAGVIVLDSSGHPSASPHVAGVPQTQMAP